MEVESNPNFRSNPGSPVSQSLIQDLGGRIRAIYLISVFSHNINDAFEIAVLVSSATQDETHVLLPNLWGVGLARRRSGETSAAITS